MLCVSAVVELSIFLPERSPDHPSRFMRRPFWVEVIGAGTRRPNNGFLLYTDVCLIFPTHATIRVGCDVCNGVWQ